MRTRGALLIATTLLGPLAVAGCHSCSRGQRVSLPDATATPMASVVSDSPARFSRPIAALHAHSGSTLVAGLVVARHAIGVTALAPDGRTLWSRDVLADVSWSANATLAVLPSVSGAVVVWRGPAAGGESTIGAAVALDGHVVGDPFAMGAAPCAIAEGLAWIDRGDEGSSLVKLRGFGAETPTLALTLPEGRDPALFCGPHHAYSLGEGDDDVMLHVLGGGAKGVPMRVIRDSEFGDDDERGHETYAVGDVFGLVRFGSSGSIATRELGEGAPSPWRRLHHRILASDDIAAVDADSQIGLVAFTRDDTSGDSMVSRTSVRAITWSRVSERDEAYELAPPDSRDRGPFWSGAARGGVAVGWAERATGSEVAVAPVVGVGYVLVGADGPTPPEHIALNAEDIVDAGCDDSHCYAVALVRAPGEDGGSPEAVSVVAYPPGP